MEDLLCGGNCISTLKQILPREVWNRPYVTKSIVMIGSLSMIFLQKEHQKIGRITQ